MWVEVDLGGSFGFAVALATCSNPWIYTVILTVQSNVMCSASRYLWYSEPWMCRTERDVKQLFIHSLLWLEFIF